MSSEKEKVFNGVFWKFAERILAQGVSFIVSIILARMIIPEAYGIVAIVMVFINIANVFVTGGFSKALIQKKDADETDFSTIFYCSFAVACIIYFVIFISAPYIAKWYGIEQLSPVLRVFSLKIIIASYNSVQHAYVSRHMIFKKFFWSTLVGTIVSGIVGLIMAFNGLGVWSLVAQYLVNSTIDMLVLTFTVKWRPKLLFSVTSASKLMSFGWKCLVSSLIGTLYNNLRSLLIGKVYTSEDLAYYNKGKNFPDLIINNAVTAITSVLFPAMSNYGDDPNAVKKITKKSIQLTSYIAFPLLIGMVAVARPMIITLLTNKWEEAVIYVQLVAISLIFYTLSEVNLQAITAVGRSDIVLKLEFIKKPVSVAMILLSLPFGVIAVAVSTPVSRIFTMAVNTYPNKKILGYSFVEQVKDVAPAAVMSLLMATIIYPIQFLTLPMGAILIVQVVVGGAIYVLLSAMIKNESYIYLKEYLTTFVKKK